MHETCLMVLAVLEDIDEPGRVLLIRKERPEWQKGRLNLPGGHVEDGETVRQAVVREVKEETGLNLQEFAYAPVHRITMICRFGNVYVFYAPAYLNQARAQTDEAITFRWAFKLPSEVMDNLKWIIPLAMDKNVLPVTVQYDLDPAWPGRAT